MTSSFNAQARREHQEKLLETVTASLNRIRSTGAQTAQHKIEVLTSALEDVEAHFDTWRAAIVRRKGGYIPNKDLALLCKVRAALAESRS